MRDEVYKQTLFNKEKYEGHRQYWREVISGELKPVALPLDFNRKDRPVRDIDSAAFSIPADLTQKLLKLSKNSDLTLYVALLTAFKTFLYRVGRNDELLVVSPRLTLDSTESGELHKYNKRVLFRDAVDTRMTFKELLLATKDKTLAAYKNQNYPLDLVFKEKGVNMAGLPFLDRVICLLTNVHNEEDVSDLNYDLRFTFSREAEQVTGKICYDAGLFKKESIRRLAGTYIKTLQSCFEDPNTRIQDIAILWEEEINQLFSRFNQPPAEFPDSKTIHRLVEEQAGKTPDHVAAVGKGILPGPGGEELLCHLSFRELNERANRLAAFLREKGVGADSIAGVMMEPCLEMVIGVLGVLKAGAAYLPIDPAYPQIRVRSMLNDCNITVLVTREDVTRNISFMSLENLETIQVKPFVSPPRAMVDDLDSLQIPDRSYASYGKYSPYIGQSMIKNSITFHFSRGCLYKCAYCFKIWPNSRYVHRSAENMFEELMFYYKMGCRKFSFVDDLPNFNIKESSKFYQLIVKNKLDIQIAYPNGLRGDILTEDYIDLMVDAGTISLDVALETTSRRLQKLIGKNMNLDKLHENLTYMMEKHPQLVLETQLLHGIPTETEEEAQASLDYLKSLKWIHIPYLHVLKIYPNTDMARLAMAHGVSKEAIDASDNLGYNELPQTLPFPKSFTHKYQSEFASEYFMLKERLQAVLPHQVKVLTENELVQKYDSLLPVDIHSLSDILDYVGISREEINAEFLPDDYGYVPDLDEKLKTNFPAKTPDDDALKVLLIDVSAYFSDDRHNVIYDVVEPPLGLMYLQTHLDRELGSKVKGKIVASRIDFDSYRELETVIRDYDPDVIGIRTMNFYKEFFHKTVSLIRQWGFDAPIITGGPYATSSYTTMLADTNIDLAVVGEGEITFAHLIGEMIDHGGNLPPQEVLEKIPGIVFLDNKQETTAKRRFRDIVMVDSISGRLSGGAAPNPEPVNNPTDLAYIIYTSGSTGIPKGVPVQHNNLVNQLTGLVKRFELDRSFNYLLLAAFTFDVSVMHLFLPLITGGKLFVISNETKKDPLMLWRYIEEKGVNLLNIVPAFMKALLESMEKKRMAFKYLFVGGDVFDRELLKTLEETFDVGKIINIYGPTETTINATLHECRDGEFGEKIPIGSPLANYRAYVLDKDLNPVPVGVPGELCLSGAGVTRGYLNHPELTAEKFIHLTLNTQNLTLYRTGDLVRWLPEGNIEFLGRIDRQVKIRGFRVEPGEIQRQISNYRGIKEALVLAREDREGERYLCAYIAPEPVQAQAGADCAGGIDEHELKKYLSGKLPGYMIPPVIIELEKIPLTSSGKIDTSALPSRETHAGDDYVAPGTGVEKTLARLWAGVVGMDVENIGIDTNFFELGGHSLKATILISRIHKELHVKIPMVELFKGPTIRELSHYLEESEKEKHTSIGPSEEKEYYPLSSAQRRLYIIQEMLGESAAYNLTTVLRLDGEVDKENLEKTFLKLIRRHESLRTSFRTIDGVPVQQVHGPQDIRFSLDWYDMAEGEEPTGTVKNFIRSFNLSEAPLIRAGLIKKTETELVLMVDMHHIISDGVSQNVLTKEFASLYTGEELPPLKLQYKDYSHWQQQQETKNNLESQEAFWLKEFEGEIPVLDIPSDYPRPAVQSFEGDVTAFIVGREETDALMEIARGEDATLFMVLLAVYNIFLAKLTGQEDIVVGSPIAGRRHEDLEKIIGMFVNILAIRNFPSGSKTFAQFLRELKEQALNVFENQEYPFEDLVEKVDVERDMSRNPLFDLVFSLENIRETSPAVTESKLGNIKIEPYAYKSGTSKFDLTLMVNEISQGLKFTLQYCTKLFKENTIRKFIQYFNKIIAAVVADPGGEIAGIEIISREERRLILHDFNDTASEYPEDKTIYQLFEEQVDRTPDNIAVVFEDSQLTYRMLDSEANRLASKLREKGVTRNSIVGIIVDRSQEMIPGILGILKAGGAYLPVNPAYPDNRIVSMLNDANASVLVAKSTAVKKYLFTKLQNLHLGNKTIYLTGKRLTLNNLDSLPIPDRSLVNYEKYNRYIGQSLVKNNITMLGTRGCPYNCAYCHKIWPKTHMVHSAAHLFEEVRLYYNMGVKRFTFLDDVFNVNQKNSRKFFELIIENGLDIQLFLCLRGDILTKDYIDLMIKAGTVRVAVALETASPRLQKLIGKNLNLDKFRENMEYLCEKYPGVILEVNTMHGFPTESEEEAAMTLEFIKTLKWIHFPYVHILKIYPNTEMEKLASRYDISLQAIADSADLAYHELPDTLPFDKDFTLKYQAEFFNEYFMSKERLLHVLPHQMNVLTEDEIVQKYDSYLPVDIKTFDDLLEFADISREQLGNAGFVSETSVEVPGLNEKLAERSPLKKASKDALRVLLLDMSQLFTADLDGMLYDVVEPPLGLIYLLTVLKQQHGEKINGKIAKSRIDFDSYHELKALLDDFKPDVIGIRTLTFYRQFFHKTVAKLRSWGIDVPIIAGGPYGTSDYETILQDNNVDLVVIGEGEVTFVELMEAVMENNGKLPGKDLLKEIPGLAYTGEKANPGKEPVREIILMDEAAELPAAIPRDEPGSTGQINHPEDTAYVIFTSGSTGKPRGVMVEHRSLNNLVHGLNTEIYNNYPEKLNLCLLSPYEFDASVKQIFASLLLGNRLNIAGEDVRLDAFNLLEFYKKYNIDISDGTPVHLQLLLESQGEKQQAPSIKRFVIGGEALPVQLAEQVLARFETAAGVSITNVYGPTECCDVTTTYTVTGQNVQQRPTTPIGRPLGNTKVYVLGPAGEVQPPGVPGELHISGAGVARGYLNRPELTAEKFVDLNRSFKTGRTYKTGDLARWLPGGDIEFLGRIDRQVKIRGFRIELMEIENQLSRYRPIEQAVVLAKENERREKYLCAYIVANRDVTVPELREYLSKNLPEYMVPLHFVFLKRIPQTPNGKIDRKALPDPEVKRGKDHIAPGNEIEKTLVAIWSEVLAIDEGAISIDSNFFEMGGHSLRTTILSAKIHKIFNVKIPMETIFKNPTIIGLSRYIDELEEDRYTSILPVEKKEYYPLSSAQKRLFFLDYLENIGDSYNIPFAFKIQGIFYKDKVEAAINALIQRHEAFRTSFELVDSEPVQRIHDTADFRVQEIRPAKEILDDTDIEQIVNEFVQPFDLEKAPLLRVGLVKLSENEHLLVYDLHHIIFDGSSIAITFADFVRLYYKEKLPPMKIQYKDFSNWQNNLFESGQIKRQEEYWHNRFSGDIPKLDFPTDHPRPEAQNFAGATYEQTIGPEDTAKLRELFLETNTTLYMVLLAIFNVLLHKYSGQTSIIVGSGIMGRPHVDLHDIIGMFVNTLPMWNRPEPGKTFKEFLEEVKGTALKAFDNQDLQFETLVDRLELERDPTRNPLFDVLFVLQNFEKTAAPQQEPPLPQEDAETKTRILPYDYQIKTSKFDFSLYLMEANDVINLGLEYSTSLFKKLTAEEILERYVDIVKQVLANKDIKLKDIHIKMSRKLLEPQLTLPSEDDGDFDF